MDSHIHLMKHPTSHKIVSLSFFSLTSVMAFHFCLYSSLARWTSTQNAVCQASPYHRYLNKVFYDNSEHFKWLIIVFRDVTLCSAVYMYWQFRITCCCILCRQVRWMFTARQQHIPLTPQYTCYITAHHIPEDSTDMCRLLMGIHSEKCVIRRFRHCANVYLHKPR